MRDPAKAAIGFLVGLPIAAVALALLLFPVLRWLHTPSAFDTVLFLAQRFGELTLQEAARLGNQLIQPTASFWFVVFGLILLFVAFQILRHARIAMRDPDESDSGNLRIALEGTGQRVGRPLAGTIRGEGLVPGERLSIDLTCDTPIRRNQRAPAFTENHSVTVGPSGTLAFRFDIPITAPATDTYESYGHPYAWSLTVSREGKFLPVGSFDVVLDPALPEEVRGFQALETDAEKAALDAAQQGAQMQAKVVKYVFLAVVIVFAAMVLMYFVAGVINAFVK